MAKGEGGGDALLTDATVAELARVAGFFVLPERLAGVTERLRDLYRLAADLEGLDLAGVEPASSYDPAWTKEVNA